MINPSLYFALVMVLITRNMYLSFTVLATCFILLVFLILNHYHPDWLDQKWAWAKENKRFLCFMLIQFGCLLVNGGMCYFNFTNGRYGVSLINSWGIGVTSYAIWAMIIDRKFSIEQNKIMDEIFAGWRMAIGDIHFLADLLNDEQRATFIKWKTEQFGKLEKEAK
jgi:hypothetical protein